MELLAVVSGLQSAKHNSIIDIYSDSKYIIDTFNKKWIDKWLTENFRIGKKDEVKNIDLWIMLLNEIIKHKVNFFWVKGHNDDYYNERCDTLANMSLNGNLLIDNGYKSGIV